MVWPRLRRRRRAPVAENRAGRVVVANASARLWMPKIAAGLARAGDLHAYCSPLGTTADEARRRWVPGRVRRALSLRALSDDVDRAHNRRLATGLDLLTVAAMRAGLPAARERLFAAKTRWFDLRVSLILGDGVEGVVAPNGAALATLRRAGGLGIAGFLDYPITHHRTNVRVMREEAGLVPDYAATIQGAEYRASDWDRLEAEVDAADYIFALGDFHRQSFLEAGVPESKLLDHPLGVDAELFSPRERLDDGVFRVIFSGQISQRKGISYLVEGFRRAAIPDSELLFIGRPIGPPDPWISTPGLRHVPNVPRYELPGLYASGDVYVMPSLLEGCCLTALEAMAMGLPTIVTPNTASVITDGEDGFVVPIRDPDAIAERLRALHADRRLGERLGAAGRATAERHDWRLYGDEMAALIRAALARRAPGSGG